MPDPRSVSRTEAFMVSTVFAALALFMSSSCPPSPTPRPWEAGSIRFLPLRRGDFVSFVGSLPHPKPGGYVPLSPARQAAFDAFATALVAALDASRKGPAQADWCAVRAAATPAGYAVERFFDTASSRLFIHASDTTADGQGHVFTNPLPKRDIVVESPHAGFESQTDEEGARLFTALAARAFLLNGADRCAAAAPAACGGNTTVCGGSFRESDVSHDPRNAFHRMHRALAGASANARFVQLHGMAGGADDFAEVADGTTRDVDPGSVSVSFAASLRPLVPLPSAVHSCQEVAGRPPSGLCGTDNIQGRHLHDPAADECTTPTSASSGRFLHVEQISTLRDDDESDGWSGRDVRDAVLGIWPSCTLGSGASDCTLGPPQSALPDCVCGGPCR